MTLAVTRSSSPAPRLSRYSSSSWQCVRGSPSWLPGTYWRVAALPPPTFGNIALAPLPKAFPTSQDRKGPLIMLHEYTVRCITCVAAGWCDCACSGAKELLACATRAARDRNSNFQRILVNDAMSDTTREIVTSPGDALVLGRSPFASAGEGVSAANRMTTIVLRSKETKETSCACFRGCIVFAN